VAVESAICIVKHAKGVPGVRAALVPANTLAAILRHIQTEEIAAAQVAHWDSMAWRIESCANNQWRVKSQVWFNDLHQTSDTTFYKLFSISLITSICSGLIQAHSFSIIYGAALARRVGEPQRHHAWDVSAKGCLGVVPEAFLMVLHDIVVIYSPNEVDWRAKTVIIFILGLKDVLVRLREVSAFHYVRLTEAAAARNDGKQVQIWKKMSRSGVSNQI
jgi:hypothetical protein